MSGSCGSPVEQEEEFVTTVKTEREWLSDLLTRKCSVASIRPFQLDHGLDLIHGRDVFLVIAPGSGKTLVSLAPLLAAQELQQSGVALCIEPSKFLTEQQVHQFQFIDVSYSYLLTRHHDASPGCL